MAKNEEMQQSDNGRISIMGDARHACRKNSYGSSSSWTETHKVVDIQHITKEDERCSQKHEELGCQRMYETFDQSNINIEKHAHDRNLGVNRIVNQITNTINTNERWHATKPIAAAINKVGKGLKRNVDISWHPQLRDKGTEVGNHVYWSICNWWKHRTITIIN